MALRRYHIRKVNSALLFICFSLVPFDIRNSLLKFTSWGPYTLTIKLKRYLLLLYISQSSFISIKRSILAAELSRKGRFLPSKRLRSMLFLYKQCTPLFLQTTRIIFSTLISKEKIWCGEGGAIPRASRAIPVHDRLMELFLCKSPLKTRFHSQGRSVFQA